MDELNDTKNDLAHLARLALSEQTEDVRLFVARMVRKYRGIDASLAENFDQLLKSKPSRSVSPYRKNSKKLHSDSHHPLPRDEESRLALLKAYPIENNQVSPFLSNDIKEALDQLIQERKHAKQLHAKGLIPTRSAIFLGKPGVGKTLTAHWIASQLGLPLYILDLTAVMSSLLGKTGNNLRAAIDFAKQRPSVLLLDEIDAIAKKRNDDTDVGELKRLVTVMLQEVEYWPASGLLLAATNHPEIVDTALWRRFDLVVEFGLPNIAEIKSSLASFLGPDAQTFDEWLDILAHAFIGDSYSDIERTVHRFRRALVLGKSTVSSLIEDFLKSKTLNLDRSKKIEIATQLANNSKLSQHAISDITGVSRDTIRKYAKNN